MTGRPNVLLITADQWRGDCLGYLGHPFVRTPHLDALAEDAVTFTRHFAPCAPCSPARASLYTGLYQMNHRVVSNGAALDDRFDNIARAGRRAGYEPTLFGYTDTALDPRGRAADDPALRSYEEVLPGFTCRQPLREDDKTWITWLRGRGVNEAVLADPHRVDCAPDGGVSLAPPRYRAEETQTAFLVEKTVDWLEEQQAGEPWFAHISFLRPHPPFVVPDPYASMVDPATVPMPITPEDGAPAMNHPFVGNMRARTAADNFQPGLQGSVGQLSPEDFRRIRAIYFGMIAEVDAQLGRLFEALRTRGMWDDTLVVFTSDHGEMLGDHGLLGKGGFYPQSQHIPLIIRPPHGGAKRLVEAFTSPIDIFPTLLDLWNQAAGHTPNGRSLRPWLEGKVPANWREAALWEFDFRGHLPEEDPRKCHMLVRHGRRSHYVQSGAFAPLLFDLEADPNLQRDIASRDQALRLAAAEALLRDRMSQNDETLAGRSRED